MSYKILAIDDDETILRLIKNILQLNGYEVTTRNGIEEVNICDFVDFDLILLDIMMPLDGITICNEIREQIKAPILFITAKDLEEDLVNGLLAGADDYITKPFSVKEFLARIKMHLRREERTRQNVKRLEFGSILIDMDLKTVFVEENEIKLTNREFMIIQLLASQTSRIFTIEEIYTVVYPNSSNTQFRSISEYIYQIRLKFKPYQLNPIETMRGGGYKWKIK